MVRGLDQFREHFSEFGDQYILIGGTACDLTMAEAGLAFRATHDLDIVLCVEVFNQEFAASFWSFVKDGNYRQWETSTGKKKFYRFQNPTNEAYPKMLELFSRVPDALSISDESRLTPIPTNSKISSLSAILLDEDYYRWIRDGKIMLYGVPIVRAEHLIPLKVRAWLDLRQRKDAGEKIDSRSIKKHKNDVFRLAQIIDPEYAAEVPDTISKDMERFLNAMVAVDSVDLKSIGVRSTSLESLLNMLKNIYHLK